MTNVPQERLSITFDCTKCGKVLQLTEKSYKKAYEGHDTCLSCRPKESNVSQERLKGKTISPLDNKLWGMDVLLLKTTTPGIYEQWLEVYGEIAGELKRLQAIEAERDRYKAMLQEIRRITPYGMYQELIDKVLKGADTQ